MGCGENFQCPKITRLALRDAMTLLNLSLLTSMPDYLDAESLLHSMANSPFVLHHDLSSGVTGIACEGQSLYKTLSGMGITSRQEAGCIRFSSSITCFQVMAREDTNRNRHDDGDMRRPGIYDLFNNGPEVISFFFPADPMRSMQIKAEIERRISGISVRSTTEAAASGLPSTHGSVHADLYYGSDRKKLLFSMLDSVNQSILSRHSSYRVCIAVENTYDSAGVCAYIRSNSVVLTESIVNSPDLTSLYLYLSQCEGIPMPHSFASKLLWLSNRIRRSKSIASIVPLINGNIRIGKPAGPNAHNTVQIGVERSTFNLGTMISGVPGTGKTLSAKSITSQIYASGGVRTMVISPTSEWNGFCEDRGMRTIDLSNPSVRFNLFRCESRHAHAFYEDLSTLIASASNAGPYQNSLEKCLLSAFTKVYSRSCDPDPVDVYTEIEDAVAEQHATKTAMSLKYTKHGENIRSSLENMRHLLMKPQFAYAGGISMRSCIRDGVVFDLSGISNSMKPILYAFLLNQAYSMAGDFDVYGDNELRMLLCVEEAHLIFGDDEDTAATSDLRQRIQDFRKKGIGLMLITHNATDISQSIRQLCQLKLYFRQSPDAAKHAANDLPFGEAEKDDVIGMLKTLPQGTCAANYIEVSDSGKSPADPIFLKIPEFYHSAPKTAARARKFPAPDTIVRLEGALPDKAPRVEVRYLGEKVHGDNARKEISIPGLLKGKTYKLFLLGDKKKDMREFAITGGIENSIALTQGPAETAKPASSA